MTGPLFLSGIFFYAHLQVISPLLVWKTRLLFLYLLPGIWSPEANHMAPRGFTQSTVPRTVSKNSHQLLVSATQEWLPETNGETLINLWYQVGSVWLLFRHPRNSTWAICRHTWFCVLIRFKIAFSAMQIVVIPWNERDCCCRDMLTSCFFPS